jgi:hypothetical protein
MTTSEKSQKELNTVIGPSKDWLMANITINAKLSIANGNGEFFMIEAEKSIDLLELSKTGTHTHKVGGDSAVLVEEISQEFFKLPIVDKVGFYEEGKNDFFVIIVKEDQDDMSLQLAFIKVELMEKHPEYDFEIRYLTTQRFNKNDFPKNSVFIPRR